MKIGTQVEDGGSLVPIAFGKICFCGYRDIMNSLPEAYKKGTKIVGTGSVETEIRNRS